jgi:glycoprotein endo-alpha-1,2-mannosidase
VTDSRPEGRKILISPRWPQLLKALPLALIISSPLAAIGGPCVYATPTAEPIYLFKIVVSTTSGWTNLLIEGIDPFMAHLSVIGGGDIPGFWCHYDNGYLTSNGASEAQPVEMDIEDLAFAGSQSARFSSSKGDLGETAVTVYRLASGSWLQLRSFTNSGTNPQDPGVNTRTFTMDPSLLYASPSSTATIKPTPPALMKMVFAFYYQWYLTSYGPGGITRHTDDPYEHQPLLGRYDSMDERVIEAHMRLAKAAGIDCLIPGMLTPGIYSDAPLPAMFRIAQSLGLKLTLYQGADRNITVTEMVRELAYDIETFSPYPAYLRADGVPVIFVYCVSYYREPSFWTEVVRELEAQVGPVYLVGDVQQYQYAEAFDGLHWYFEPNVAHASSLYDTYTAGLRLKLDGIDWDQAMDLIARGESLPLRQRFLAFTVIPGQDLTKIGKIGYLDRRDGQTYKDFWEVALAKDPDGVLITSWNEWHEGTEIEPSVEFGFTYTNLTRQYTSLFKGGAPTTSPTSLKVQTDLASVLRRPGAGTAFLGITDDSPGVQAIYVNLSVSLSGGLSLSRVNHSAFYAYIEKENARAYNVVIPLLKPGETIPFTIAFTASIGKGSLRVTATGYSPSGAATTSSTAREVQVINDRVVIDLMASEPRVEVGSEALINMSAHYEYDRQPFSGTIHLNDTLTKNSEGTYHYTVSGISDNLYGLTSFTSNAVSIVFDHIIVSPTTETTAPGGIGVTARLSFESDGRPVDGATVTVNGVPARESSPGIFQATVATWSPLYQLNVVIERPGFSPQNITLSGYATGNVLLVIVAMTSIIISFVMVMKVKRKSSMPPPPPPSPP